MSWNHRVLAHKHEEEVYFQIHEVYYNEEGIPNSHTERGITVGADSLEDLKWTLNNMQECIEKPILSAENFPKEYKG